MGTGDGGKVLTHDVATADEEAVETGEWLVMGEHDDEKGDNTNWGDNELNAVRGVVAVAIVTSDGGGRGMMTAFRAFR